MQTIVWAVDPFLTGVETQETVDLQNSAAWALRNFLVQLRPATRVIPIYAWDAISLMTPLAPPSSWIQETREAAEARLAQLLERVQIPSIEPLRVLTEPSLPLRFRAEHLSQEAQKLGASLIFTATRGAPAPRRWIQGSFSEALVARSDLPVLSINGSWNRATNFSEFSFITDFSAASLAGFAQLLPWVRALNSNLVLYHLLQAGPSGEQPEAPAAEIQARWRATAQAAGIDPRIEIDRRENLSVLSGILDHSQRHPGVLGLVLQGGSIRSAWRGNLVRRLVRSTSAPLFTVRSSAVVRVESPLEDAPIPQAG